MTTLRERIEHRIRDEICPLCRQDSRSSHCEAGDEPCPLIDHLDQVMEIISGIRDYSLEPYRDKLRQVVCAACASGQGDVCARRERRDCALDAYFPKIVAIIESELEADAGLG